MPEYVNVADLKDPDDPEGRTYREVNEEKVHAIPLGELVEIERSGVRLFVLKHTRDCDRTPLYTLGPAKDCSDWNKVHGYSEESLTVVPQDGDLGAMEKEVWEYHEYKFESDEEREKLLADHHYNDGWIGSYSCPRLKKADGSGYTKAEMHFRRLIRKIPK